MGKNTKDKKKKGLGAAKTLAKTEKKIEKSFKKELEEIGEEDVESLIAQFNEKESEQNQVKEEVLAVGECPSRRGGATFSLFPEREEFVMFGGEFYDGHKVTMHNDLFLFSIKKSQWTRVRAPKGPPPRTFHQAAVVARNGGELWIFGGEFSSPSQSQFYHYNDLWVYHFTSKQWTKINVPNGPSPRSGHRMVVFKKYLLVFGGYYDNLRSCRFYNDAYLFNLETSRWEEMKFAASGQLDLPSPRSACQLAVCAKNNTVVLYGGFSKEKLKKENEKGVVHTDMFVLSLIESKKGEKCEWNWKRVKQSGMKPSERISFSMIPTSDDTALLFGGVFDNEDEDDIDDDDEESSTSSFFNDLYKLDLTSFKWSLITLRGKREIKKKTTKPATTTATTANASMTDESANGEDIENDTGNEDSDLDDSTECGDVETEKADADAEILPSSVEKLKLNQSAAQVDDSTGAFTLTLAAVENRDKLDAGAETTTVVCKSTEAKGQSLTVPSPRRSAYMQYHKSQLYVYGGKYEDKGGKELTFNDMLTLNVKKLDEWKTLFEDKQAKRINDVAVLKNASDATDSWDDDDDDSDDDSDMEIDAPKGEPGESQDDYFARTADLWISEATKEFPDEKSKKKLTKMARELCALFWDNLSQPSNGGDNSEQKATPS